MRPRLLITGASGLLGGNLLYQLSPIWDIVGVVNEHEIETTLRGVQMARANLLEDDIEKLFGTYGPFDSVIHTAAMTNVDGCEKNPDLARALNATLPTQLAQICATLRIHFVHISTDHIFDGKTGNYTEESPPQPLNMYAKTKYEGERGVQEVRGTSLIIRTNFFGWNIQPKQDLVGWILDALRAKKEIPSFTDVWFSPIVVHRLIDALRVMIARKTTGIFHVASADACSKYAFACELAHVFDFDPSYLRPTLIETIPPLALRPKNMSLNTKYVQETLGIGLPTVGESVLAYKKYCDEGYGEKLRQALCVA